MFTWRRGNFGFHKAINNRKNIKCCSRPAVKFINVDHSTCHIMTRVSYSSFLVPSFPFGPSTSIQHALTEPLRSPACVYVHASFCKSGLSKILCICSKAVQNLGEKEVIQHNLWNEHIRTEQNQKWFWVWKAILYLNLQRADWTNTSCVFNDTCNRSEII